MRLAAVRVVWAKELRETLRDRRTLAVMLLFPLVVYPLISLLMTEVMAGKQASDGMRPSRVAIVGGDAVARAILRGVLEARPPRAAKAAGAPAAFADDGEGNTAAEAATGRAETRATDAAKEGDSAAFVLVDGAGTVLAGSDDGVPASASGVAAGKIDAVIDLDAPSVTRAPSAPGAATTTATTLTLTPGPPATARTSATRPVRLVYDETRPASDQAHDRLAQALGRVLPAGCAPVYAVAAVSLASRTKVGGYVLSKILPLVVVIMTMLGAFYPAIDITAGERERGTLETVLSAPIHRFDLMTGKVLAVATLATITGALNIVSMSLTVAETARLAAGAVVLDIPWTRALATLLIVVPAAFLFGSVMVAIGAMARSFKEAQTLLMPVYLMCLTPSLVTSVGDFPLTGITLLVPGTNLTLLARDLMLGAAHLLPAIVVLASTLAFGAAALAFAARLYDSERLLTSSDADLITLRAWLRHLVGRPPAADRNGSIAIADSRAGTGSANDSTGSANDSTASAGGSTGSANDSTGSADGSTGSADGSTGSADGSTGSADGSTVAGIGSADGGVVAGIGSARGITVSPPPRSPPLPLAGEGRGEGTDARRPLPAALAPASDSPTASQALALFGVAFILWFFVFTWLQHWRLLPGLLLSQWGGFLGLVWIFARLTRRPLADVLVFRRPRPAAVIGAVCLGMSCWLVLGMLADRLMPPPREVVDAIRHLIRPPGQDRPLWLSVFALAVTPAVCEEALFRGPILRGLRRQLSPVLACVMTGILFGVLHGDVWRFVPTALLGALLSWVALTSGSIVPSMIVHIVNNTTLIVLGYYGLDEAGEHLSTRSNLLLLVGAVSLLVAGLAAVRAGRQPPAAAPPDVVRRTT